MASPGGVDNLSDEHSDYNCTVCERDTKQISAADYYCFECSKYLCANKCLSDHNRFGDRHTVLKTSDRRVQNILTERCEKHPDQVINFICRQHDKLLCSVCSFLDHKACTDVKHIGESADDLTADPDIQAIPGHLQSALDHVTQVMKALDKHVHRIQEKENMYLNGLEKYLRTILSIIQDMRKREIDNISETGQKLTSKVNESRQACKDIKADLSKYASEIDRSKNRQAHLIVLKKKSQAIARKAESLCEESEQIIEDTSFSSIFNMALVEELNKCNSLQVGFKKNKLNIRTAWAIFGSSYAHSCCCLDEGTIFLTDKSLTRLDPVNNTFTDVLLHLRYRDLFGVCSVGPQEVAVAARRYPYADETTDYLVPCIQFYDVAKGTKTSELEIAHKFSCIAYHSGDLFVGSLNSLHVYSRSPFSSLASITDNACGRSLFSNISSITVNKRGDRIYVADSDIGLICLSRDGQEIFSLTNKQLGVSRATGVTTDHWNQVLICGYNSHNLVQVTENGRVIGEILSEMDGINNPRWLCFDDVRQKLYVGGEMGHVLGLDFM